MLYTSDQTELRNNVVANIAEDTAVLAVDENVERATETYESQFMKFIGGVIGGAQSDKISSHKLYQLEC